MKDWIPLIAARMQRTLTLMLYSLFLIKTSKCIRTHKYYFISYHQELDGGERQTSYLIRVFTWFDYLNQLNLRVT